MTSREPTEGESSGKNDREIKMWPDKGREGRVSLGAKG